ncbi:hypothetical protein D9757_003138 [Collybiopsis confluens]|uniref:Laccase n=1 Tax=Collybiopsis confluens TaxID=2823264 RepID=A0A8H5MEI3_9AGAR|nr:hypothetical protein D9757_003138 [Collybiopsis confluens]
MLPIALGLVALLPFAAAELRNFVLNIENKVLAPDGFERAMIAPNGTYPGPTFMVQKGDSVDIAMNNVLNDPTMRQSVSIHWHGFFQARTSYADGPSFVNQCPIPPNTTFHYAFDTAGQTGNYWYHSHLSTQYCDGLRGAFVVYDPNDPLGDLYDVDESTVITLSDWYHTVAPEAQATFFQSGTVPIPDSGLINGVGRYIGGTIDIVILARGPYAVINVVQGKRYRFRVFALSCRPFFTWSIDNHNLTVMEFDGVEHDPVTVQNVDVYAAQRISAVVEANQPVANYWMRAPPTGGAPAPAGNPNFNPNLTLAIVRYAGAPVAEPTSNNTGIVGTKLDDANMHPIASENPGKLGSGPPDIFFELNIAQPNPPFFDINNISYISPTVPVLLQILSGAAQPTDFLPSDQVLLITPNATIEVSIPGTGAHPFHLHGHNFDVIRQPNSNVTNFVNPPRRDVTPINGGNTTFRFKADNPGAWFLHCHIDWHLEAGLAVVFAESPSLNLPGTPFSQTTPQDWEALCPDYNALQPEFQ